MGELIYNAKIMIEHSRPGQVSEIDAFQTSNPHLFVHPAFREDGRESQFWSITHAPSKRAIFYGLKCIEDALEIVQFLSGRVNTDRESGEDFTRLERELCVDIQRDITLMGRLDRRRKNKGPY